MAETKTHRRRTIDEELLAQWRELTRTGDAKAIAKLLEVSQPTIEKAIIYGHVNQQRLIDGINKYFADRLKAEKQQAAELKELNKDHVIPPPVSADQPKRAYTPPAVPVPRDPETGKFLRREEVQP